MPTPRRILIINGHPDKESYSHALAAAYSKGALASGAEVQEIVVADLAFDPILRFGYRKQMDLEPDLQEAWAKILWAQHLVWVYPVWWAGLPALLKGFIDRLFLPGRAFKKRPGSLLCDKYMKGRSAHLISTMDQPVVYYWLMNRRPTYWAMKRNTLEFCGIKPVRTTTIGPIRLSTDDFRAKWLLRVERLGARRS